MAATPGSTPRVPAWKKLGLSLKYAKDDAQDSAPPTPDHGSAASRKRSRSDAEKEGAGSNQSNDRPSETPSKKSKKRKVEQAEEHQSASAETEKSSKKEKKREKKSKSKAVLLDRTTSEPATSESQERDAALSTPVRKLKRKKSVSFTPDTKKSDGDSGQQLFKAWAKTQTGSSNEDSIVPSTESSAIEDDESASEPEAPSSKDLKKAKKEQRKAAKASESANEPKELPPYVTYLQHYHSDRSTWKFNKKHQVDLLKSIFNFYRVPASCDSAVEAYIGGLQGGAARYRLKQQAEEVLKETEDKDKKSEEAKQLLAKRRRAEKVLKALGHVEEPAIIPGQTKKGEVQKQVEAPEESNKKRARPRKQRTADEDLEISSSEDESSSSDEDSSSDESSVVSSSSEDPSSESETDSDNSSSDHSDSESEDGSSDSD